jgi:hypothetical protein
MTKRTLMMILGMLACLSSGAMAQRTIVWVSSTNTGTFGGTTNNDQGFVDVLTAAGFTVTREFFNAATPTLAADVKARLEAANLVIISRTNGSGNYGDIAAWNGITKPILSLMPHVVRSDSPRWKWLNTTASGEPDGGRSHACDLCGSRSRCRQSGGCPHDRHFVSDHSDGRKRNHPGQARLGQQCLDRSLGQGSGVLHRCRAVRRRTAHVAVPW